MGFRALNNANIAHTGAYTFAEGPFEPQLQPCPHSSLWFTNWYKLLSRSLQQTMPQHLQHYRLNVG